MPIPSVPSPHPRVPGCIAIVGASANPERPSHHAVQRFAARGWTVWPVHPAGMPIADLPTSTSLNDLPGRPDVICFYINPALGLPLLDTVAALAPQMLWLNPGAADPAILAAAQARGIPVIADCILVALATGRDPREVR